MTARSEPGDWGIALADLRSRLAATPRVAIGAPDDALLAAVFAKLWRDRGVEPDPDLARYLLSRIERSFESLGRAVDLIDRAALAAQRAPTIPLAREALLDL
jgi:chromosomal replication initiation ATPase DnaA